MNKKELVDASAAKTDSSSAAADRAENALVGIISDTLKKGDSLTLPGFGAFEVRDRAAQTGSNPQTSEELKIAASKIQPAHGVLGFQHDGLRSCISTMPPSQSSVTTCITSIRDANKKVSARSSQAASCNTGRNSAPVIAQRKAFCRSLTARKTLSSLEEEGPPAYVFCRSGTVLLARRAIQPA